MTYNIKLDMFEGPFDLLYHLIEKKELDICMISISQITGEYIEYIKSWQSYNLDIASEFIFMAASLLALKAKVLLPKRDMRQEDDEDEVSIDLEDDDDLIQQLLEYRKFKSIAFFMREKEDAQSGVFVREKCDFDFEPKKNLPEGAVSLQELLVAFKDVYNKMTESDEMEVFIDRGKTVAQKMQEIEEMLIENSSQEVELEKLLFYPITRYEVIITFLAILELIRENRVIAMQKKAWGNIFVSKLYA